MDAILCHNPSSGGGVHKKRDILAALKLAGIEARYISTKGRSFPEALEEKADLIIAAGGDGTVGKVIKAMPNRKIPLAIMPLGTANNIARSLDIAGTPPILAESWRLDRWRPFDVGQTRGPWPRKAFIEGIGFGSIAATMKKTNGRALLEPAGKRIAAGRAKLRKTLLKAKPIESTIRIDDVELPASEILAVEILNVSYTGPGLELPKQVDPGDGLLSVIIIHANERDDVLEWLEAPHLDAMPVRPYSGKKVEFTWHSAPLRLDDAIVNDLGNGKHSAMAKIVGKPIRVLTPPARAEKEPHSQEPAQSA